MENLDLSFLKNCPQGRELYSPAFGEMTFQIFNGVIYTKDKADWDNDEAFVYLVTWIMKCCEEVKAMEK